ncbi:hypothetical protein [Amycolatopsis keratiniphila]|uniref:hypothetical protein n=1 Tax=Amycolatopsis keratiniphila TaxID=129921 RepID=UPI000ACF6933|nr:hypothetical protein [Amycolatopsis keratiniphila]
MIALYPVSKNGPKTGLLQRKEVARRPRRLNVKEVLGQTVSQKRCFLGIALVNKVSGGWCGAWSAS